MKPATNVANRQERRSPDISVVTGLVDGDGLAGTLLMVRLSITTVTIVKIQCRDQIRLLNNGESTAFLQD